MRYFVKLPPRKVNKKIFSLHPIEGVVSASDQLEKSTTFSLSNHSLLMEDCR